MKESGELGNVSFLRHPDKKVVACSRADHLSNRQLEPHNHAIILDPFAGNVAFVPDLGTDVIKQFVYDKHDGSLTPAGQFPCGEGA